MAESRDVKLDQGLTLDEEQRLAQHEKVKEKVRGEVHGEIEKTIDDLRGADEERVGSVAREMKEKALGEVRRTEADIARGRGAARASQIVDYVFYLIYGLIGLEIFLTLIGASDRSPFKRFLDAITTPILAPFRGLIWNPSVGPFRLMLSYVIALGVYFLLQRAVRGLLRMLVHRRTEV
jgi:uncharacterized protein YggT (Ycf19 family)